MAITGSVKKLTKLQVGKEVTPGTAVAQTARLLGEGTVRDLQTNQQPIRDYALLDVMAENAVPISLASELSFVSELSSQQLLYLLRSGVRKVSGVEQTGGQGDYLYTFAPIAAADPAIEALTLAYQAHDGTGVVQNLRSAYNFATEIGIAMQGSSPSLSQMHAIFAGRGPTATAITGALGIPARTLVANQKWVCKVAAAIGSLGAASAIAGGLVNFDWKLKTGLKPKYRANNSLDFFEHSFADGRQTDLTLTIDLSALAETLRTTYFDAGTPVAVRLQWTGPQIAAGTNHSIIIDGLYQVQPPDAPGNDNGQMIQTFKLVGQYEAAAAEQFAVSVTTNIGVDPT
jgi:hypothetical protein